MIKQIAWNTFKNTGDINTFLELMEFKNVEKELEFNRQKDELKVNEYGNTENKGNNFTRK